MDFAQMATERQQLMTRKGRTRKTRTARKFYLPDRVQLVKWIVLGGSGGFALLLLILAGVFAWYSRNLPSPDRVVRREGFSTQIMSREGELLYDVYSDVQREPVKFNDVPEHLKRATISIEDKNFYTHEGFDPFGIARAMFNIVFRGRLQGGSTLTQQLVKNVLLTSERTLPRKIKEFVLAVQIENKFTKDEILKMYLQEAPYGGSAVGVEVAARTYFTKPLNELDLVESAFLAGMPQAPTRYSPYGVNPQAYVGRTEQVLRRMREDGYISREQEEEALSQIEELQFKPPGQSIKAPHFVMYVRSLLVDQFGEAAVESGGLRVTTTLDLPLQEKAQAIVAEEIEKVEYLDITNGAAIAMNPENGEILAMVGSRDFLSETIDGQVNVTLRPRQPGSAIKPVTYAAAFRRGYPPSMMIVDAPTSFDSGDPEKPYEPINYDNQFRGPVQLRFALGSSLNVPSVKLLQLVGVKEMLSLAYEMGLRTLEPTLANLRRLGLSVTLGGGEIRLIEMVTAYSAFSNGGTKIEPVAILKVEDTRGNTLFEHHQTRGSRVLSDQEAFLVNHILSDNNARLLTFGQNSLLNMGSRPVAVKTGTTNDLRDNWAVGWSRSVIVASWVGNNDNSPMKSAVSGVSGATPIWRRLMLEGLNSYPAEAFPIPERIVVEQVDTISGYRAHDDWPSRAEYFIEGTVLEGPDPIHTRLKACGGEEKEYVILKAPLSLLEPDRERWQTGIDAWIGSQTDERYRPPEETCDQELEIRVLEPGDRQRFDTNDIDWEIKITSSRQPNKIEIFVDGTSRQTLTEPPWRSTIHLDDGAYNLKFKARVEGGQEVESDEIKIGVNRDWDYSSPSTPTPTPPAATATLPP